MCVSVITVIRFIIWLDVAFGVAVIGQQIWYTNYLFEYYDAEQEKLDNNNSDHDIKPSLKSNGTDSQDEENSIIFGHIPVQWILPYSAFVIALGASSVLVSGRLLVSMMDNKRFRDACNMFNIWMGYTMMTVLVAFVVFVIGFPIAAVVLQSVFYMIVRLGFAVIVSEIFISLMLVSSAINYFDQDSITGEENQSEVRETDQMCGGTRPTELDTELDLEAGKNEEELLSMQTIKRVVLFADEMLKIQSL